MKSRIEDAHVAETGRGLSRRDFLKGVAAAGVAVGGGLILPSREAYAHGNTRLNPLEHKTYDDLRDFTGWLRRERARGFVGEVNWPNNVQRNFGDAARWNSLGEKWYQWADSSKLWVTMWAVDEWQRWGGFWLTAYTSKGDGSSRPLSRQMAQAPVLEHHGSTRYYRRGVNVSGAEGLHNDRFSNRRPGVYNDDYWYASQQSMNYLARRGVKVIRLPFRWERIQPVPGGQLRRGELRQLKAAVGRARAARLRVILDVHNYGGYTVDRGRGPVRLALGSSSLPASKFFDLWGRLSNQFKGNPTVLAYDLMNEPAGQGGISSAGHGSSAKAWEAYTQRCLATIRQNRDRKLIMIPMYSGMGKVSSTHPKKWISDPARHHMYTAHQYFDTYRGPGTGGGHYVNSYSNEVAYLRSRGY